MISSARYTLISLSFIICISTQTLRSANSADQAWPDPKTENRPGAYWWWLGSAVDKENLTWNLETMRKAGMGGGTIVAIYGTDRTYKLHFRRKTAGTDNGDSVKWRPGPKRHGAVPATVFRGRELTVDGGARKT